MAKVKLTLPEFIELFESEDEKLQEQYEIEVIGPDADDEEEEGDDDDEEEGDEEAEDLTEDEILEMSKKELVKLIDDEELDVEPKDFKKVADLREAVSEAYFGVEEDDEEEEGDEDEEEEGDEEEEEDDDVIDVGDVVVFKLGRKKVSGEVVSVDDKKGTCKVKIGKKKHTVTMDDVIEVNPEE